MNKIELLREINLGLDVELLEYEFHRIKKHNMEYSKNASDLRYNYSFNILDRFDTHKRCSYFNIEPHISIYHKEASAILNKIFEMKPREEFYLLTTDVAAVANNPSGELKNRNTTLDIRHYPNTDIHFANGLLLKAFKDYGLPFYNRFKNLDDIYSELIKPVTYSSIYAWVYPRRFIYSIIVSHLLGKSDTKLLADSYQGYFSTLDNKHLVSVYENLRKLLFG